ncbi:MAG: chorismate mutase [Candidatus Tokpelaia sp. JSC161]|jgi:chorismate mutase|nr:MAG: chorismate mutase [Candidatus Tokpelaia sp. JSC161]
MKEESIPQELLVLRDSIDNFDAALIHILAERFRCTEVVGMLKARFGLASVDHDRERVQVDRLRFIANKAHLDPDFAERFFKFIVREVVRHHEGVVDMQEE